MNKDMEPFRLHILIHILIFYAQGHWRLFYPEMDKATNGISAIF